MRIMVVDDDRNILELVAIYLRKEGYEVIMWSLDTIDWQNPDVATIVKRVVPRIHNDAIILMHPTKPTVEALPQIIKKLKEEGYQMVPVSMLIPESTENNPDKDPSKSKKP